jgi:hypothetical protein
MTSNTIDIKISLDMLGDKYRNITGKEEFYSSPEYFKAYHYYRKSRSAGYNWRDIFTNSASIEGLEEVSAAFHENIRRLTDEAIQEAAAANGATFKR